MHGYMLQYNSYGIQKMMRRRFCSVILGNLARPLALAIARELPSWVSGMRLIVG